jgi:integrase/recombinase XerD
MEPRLVCRVKQTVNGKTKYVSKNVNFTRNGKVIPVPEAIRFYIRCAGPDGKRTVVPAGKSLELAVISLKRKQGARVAAAAPVEARKTIADAVLFFVDELHALDKSQDTIRLYRNAVAAFAESCPKVYLDEITRDDVIAYIGWIKANVKRRHGDQTNTVRNRLRFLTVFFSRNGMKNPLPARDWPRGSEKEPDQYALAEVNALLAVANPAERLLIETFLYTGFRDAEVGFLEYSDIDFRNNSVNIGPKPHLNWTTKNQKPRSLRVPLPPDYVQRMKERRDASKTNLVFPNRDGTPNRHLIKLVRAVAVRAGWKAEQVRLHRFRRTFASMYSTKFPIQTIQKLLGHNSVKTTLRYLAASQMDTPESKQAVTEVFAGVHS